MFFLNFDPVNLSSIQSSFPWTFVLAGRYTESGNRNHSIRGFTKASSRNRWIMATAAVAKVPLAPRNYISPRHLDNGSCPVPLSPHLIFLHILLKDRF